MRQRFMQAALLALAAGLAGTANAAVDYHFVPALNGQPYGCAQWEEIAPVSGPNNFKVTVAGARCGEIPNGAPQDAYAYLDKWGLGVLNPLDGSDKNFVGQVQLDTKNGGEFIQLEFPKPVKLCYLTFASVGIADMFTLEADDVALDMGALFPGQNTIREISLSQSPNTYPGHIDFTKAAQPLPYASKWEIIATAGDGFQLENCGVCPIPEPSTMVLWLVGLGVVGVSVVRRRKASTE